jgi:hypothetical protein
MVVIGAGKSDDRKYGFVNKAGELMIKPQYSAVSSFSDGLALVNTGETFERNYGYVNKDGQAVIKPRFKIAFSFSEGIARVLVDDDEGFLRAILISQVLLSGNPTNEKLAIT